MAKDETGILKITPITNDNTTAPKFAANLTLFEPHVVGIR